MLGLQILGVKLFSVSPSEMCDERTASKMTAFNTAKRNGLSGDHIIQMAQLQQHWTRGLNTPKFTHNAHLKLPKTKPATTIHLPTPTLADLLNPTAADEEFMFNHPDPYGALEMSEEEEDEEGTSVDASGTQPAPTTATTTATTTTAPAASAPTIQIIRGARRLQIDDLIDLSNVSLLKRYLPDAERAPPASTPTLKPSGKAKEWVKESFSMTDLSF